MKWSEKDIRILRKFYLKNGWRIVYDLLENKRSQAAIISKAFKLGLRSTFQQNKKHEYVGTRTYRAWYSAIQRCINENHPYFYLYGGLGIGFYAPWKDFRIFLRDMGQAPSEKHQIDRIDSTKDYEPNNCRWATPSQQCANRKFISKTGYKGVIKTKYGKYVARIGYKKKKLHIGTYHSSLLAAMQYDKKATELYGPYAMTNEKMGLL